MRRRFTLVLLSLVSATALADIAPPPAPLHRVGYEVLPRELTHAAVCLGTAGGVLFVLGFLLAVSLFLVVKCRKTLKRRTKCVGFAASLCGLVLGGVLAACFSPPAKVWKYPSQVFAWEAKRFEEICEAGKDELQRRFDSEYARMNAAKELERVGVFSGGYRYMYDRGVGNVKTRNRAAVVKRILERDAKLRAKYDGVPIELIAGGMDCPEPSIDDESVKNAFRAWAVGQMPRGLNGVERQIVFDWQYAFYESEKRPWRRVFNKPRETEHPGSSIISIEQPDDTDALVMDPDGGLEVEGFGEVSARLSAREYVLAWAERAKSAGHAFRSHETALAEKAKDANRGFGKRGIVGFMCDREVFSSGWYDGETRVFPNARLTFRGAVDRLDLDLAADFCRQLRKDNGWYCELEELRFVACPPETVRNVFAVLSGFRVHKRVYVTGGKDKAMDMAGIQGLEVRAIVFVDTKVKGFSTPFEAPGIEELLFMDCDVVDLSFVRGLVNVGSVAMNNCSVSDCADLAGLQKLRTVRITGSRGPVDLGFVRGSDAITSLFIQGSQVSGADAIGTCRNLSSLDISRCSWDANDWLSAVRNCPRDICVTYDETDIPSDSVVAFKRLLRAKRPRAKRSAENELNEAVADGDIEEVERLLRSGASAKKCLNSLVEGRFMGLSSCLRTTVKSVDLRILQTLLDHGGRIGRCHNGESALCEIWTGETPRVGLVEMLLSQGCDPNEQHGRFKRVALDGVLSLYQYHGYDDECVKTVKLLLDHGADPNLMTEGHLCLTKGKPGDLVNRVKIALLLNEHGLKKSKLDIRSTLKCLLLLEPERLKRILDAMPPQRE